MVNTGSTAGFIVVEASCLGVERPFDEVVGFRGGIEGFPIKGGGLRGEAKGYLLMSIGWLGSIGHLDFESRRPFLDHSPCLTGRTSLARV